MQPFVYPGCIDGESLIHMNNLAVGYLPSKGSEVGVFPSPMPVPVPYPVQPEQDQVQRAEPSPA